MLFIAGVAPAQLHNASNLYVGTGIEVHVDGAISNTGFVQNQGELFVAGDWLNSNIYQGLGRITLDGSATQRLKNNTNNFYSLRINSGGNIDWQDNIVIDNRLELLKGIIRVTDPYALTLAASATVEGGSQSSYVEGPVISRGTGYRFFPVGKGGGYYPVDLLDVAGIDPVVKVEAFDQMETFRLAGYDRVLSDVYWQQTTLGGTYTGSPVTLGYNLPQGSENGLTEIFQSASSSELFTPAGNTSVAYESGNDKITTSSTLNGTLLLIGSRVVVAPGTEKFYFPTSLSPEAADPNNRSIRVFGAQLTEEGFLFVVFNRWGQQVFESRSLEFMSTTGWSGQQHTGGTLSSGAYPYVIKGKLKSGEAMEQKGMISILR